MNSKDKYLSVAAKLFAQKGFAGVSIRELASAARANSALISYYFGSKEGLYSEVLKIQFAPILELIDTFRYGANDPEERLYLYARGVMYIHQRFPFVLQLVHNELHNPTPFLNSIIVEHIKKVRDFLCTTIQNGIASGHFRQDVDPSFAVITLAGMLNFYFIVRPIAKNFLPLHSDSNSSDCDQQFVQQAMEIFLRGIRRTANE